MNTRCYYDHVKILKILNLYVDLSGFGNGQTLSKKIKRTVTQFELFFPALDLEIICHACVHQDIEIVIRERAQML